MPRPVVAIIGRPNVGKSTLFNRIAGSHLAIVEDLPGVTRDRNYAETVWEGKPFLLVDTGGFEPESTDAMYLKMREQTTLAIEEADIILFLMDGQQGLLPADVEVSQRLRASGKPVLYGVSSTVWASMSSTRSRRSTDRASLILWTPSVGCCPRRHRLPGRSAAGPFPGSRSSADRTWGSPPL